jgi:NADH-quinone oxidoreductase subunit H
MQFAWLILIPATLINIIVTAVLYLVMNGLGSPNWLFQIVLGIVNFAMLIAFIYLVTRATTATTRRAQAPAILAQRRATAAGQLSERAGASVASSGQQ